MSRVKICQKCGAIAEWDSYFGGTRCTRCDFVEKPKQTNADRIRAMSDEEMADFVWGVETAGRAYGPRGKKAWLDWLKQEVTTNSTT